MVHLKLTDKIHGFIRNCLLYLEYPDEMCHFVIMVIMRKGLTYGGPRALQYLSRLFFVNERVKIGESVHELINHL